MVARIEEIMEEAVCGKLVVRHKSIQKENNKGQPLGIFNQTNKLLMTTECFIILAGCDIELNINSNKEVAEQGMENTEQHKAPLEEEISINGLGLYDSADAVENEFGDPTV